MGSFFSRDRFGRPQILAGLMLVVFLGECGWLMAHEPLDATPADELSRVRQGAAQWRGHGIAGTPKAGVNDIRLRNQAFDTDHAPVWYLVGSAGVAVLGVAEGSRAWLFLTHAPFIFIGTLLGASVWYVSRRLYGNSGGYMALALYCSSPSIIRSSALWFSPPHVAAVWGTFGAVFTAIAVSHTLYAPREVVLWNWRRIVLLGISLALALSSQFALVIVIPLLLAFMLYLAPERRGAALAILGSACAIGLMVLYASYSFLPGLFWDGLRSARWITGSPRAFAMRGAYVQVFNEIAASGPALLLMMPLAIVIFAIWRRTRYFGNTAPLLAAVVFLAMRVFAPHGNDSPFTLAGVVFGFVFVAGIAADLLESSARDAVLPLIAALVAANALWNLIRLAGVA
jgi:hypothetical protein